MKICVNVETWFAGGIVVTYTDKCGVEYRGALLKRTDESPEFKGPDNELASPLTILHDHSYCQIKGKRAWKQVPATVLLGWNSASPPLTPQHTVCKRNGFVKSLEKRAIVEAETEIKWPYFQNRGERNAKYLARLRLKESQIDDTRTSPVRKKIRSPRRVKGPSKIKPKKKISSKSVLPTGTHLVSCDGVVLPAVNQLLPNVSPSLIAQAQQCTVGLTPTNTAGISSPLSLPPDLSSSSSSFSSPSSTASTSLTPQMKPFSISLQRFSLPQVPLLPTALQV